MTISTEEIVDILKRSKGKVCHKHNVKKKKIGGDCKDPTPVKKIQLAALNMKTKISRNF